MQHRQITIPTDLGQYCHLMDRLMPFIGACYHEDRSKGQAADEWAEAAAQFKAGGKVALMTDAPLRRMLRLCGIETSVQLDDLLFEIDMHNLKRIHRMIENHPSIV